VLAEALHNMLRVGILAGIAYRRRWHACLGFVGYHAFDLAARAARMFGIASEDSWAPWLAVQLVQRIFALAVALEIGARIFHRNAPTGRAYTARAVCLVLCLGLAAAIAWGRQLQSAHTDGDVYDALVEGERRISGTAMWVFLAVFAIAELRFHWPIDPYHRDIFIGFGVYLAATFLFSPDPGMPVQLPAAWPVWLYTAVLLLWVRAAWRGDDFTRVAPRFRPQVFPWARHKP
jgi:hypothetical protein